MQISTKPAGWLILVLATCQALTVIAGTDAIRLADLPDNSASCASPQVKSALFACKLSGPSPACCEGLDKVFANSSSPSSRCPCLPKVLYGTITQAAKLGLDVLGLLQACKKTNSSSFKTQWATGEGTLCPNISVDARLGDMLPELGDAVVIPSSKSRNQWAWANMLQFGEVMGELKETDAIVDKILGTKALQFVFVIMISMPTVFLALHHGVLMRLSAAYQGLSAADRMISCQHAVYAVVFWLSLVPQTVLACMSLFSAWTGTFLASNYITLLVALLAPTRAVLYVVEACLRSVIKWSWLLIVHHTLYLLVICLAVWTKDIAVVGIGLVLDLFACHEAPLYVALLAYRLQWPPRLARGILRGGCVWYIITRIVQTVMLVYILVQCLKLALPGQVCQAEYQYSMHFLVLLLFVEMYGAVYCVAGPNRLCVVAHSLHLA